MYDVCDSGAVPDVLRRNRSISNDKSCSWLHEPKGRMRRIYIKSVADAAVQSSGRAYNRGSGRRMQSDDENIFPRITTKKEAIIHDFGLLLYLCWAIRSERRRYHHSLSYWSVNEAVNDVPCGVCFSDPLGRIVLCNTKMQELSRIMTGSYLQDYEALRKSMNGEPESEGLCRLSKDSNVFYFPDGSVWMFQEYSLQEPDCAGYLQTVAVNVSEIYYNGEKIRANNEKLEILNHKLEEMYEKIGDKIREQETLVMKMQVHDNFGRSLLSIRRILERKEDPDKMDKQLSVLKHLVYILTGSAVESMEEVYKDTIRHAEELGISVRISGNFPMHPSYRLLTDRAIRECVTNCARHAHGTAVYVEIKNSRDGYQIQITNNGEPPSKNAKEGGGLSALRKAVEAEQGTMKTFFEPAFYLFLNFPLKE